VAGYTGSRDSDITTTHGGYDAWIVKLTDKKARVDEVPGAESLSLNVYSSESKLVSVQYSIPHSVSAASLTLSSITGETIRHSTIEQPSGTVQFDLQSIPSGTYFLTLRAEGLAKTVPFQIR